MVVLLILFGSACYASASAQIAAGPQSRNGVFGRVVNSETHDPVRRADVKVYTSKEQWDDFTDGEGRFNFPHLVAGEYTLIAHRDGYTDRAYKVGPSDFDEPKELRIELRPQGLISGRAADAAGHALQSVRIQALGARSTDGKKQVIATTETDDLGEYRLSGLDPGTYRLRAVYRDGRASEFDPTPLTMASSDYGGSETPAEIVVKAGSLTTGVDFILDPVRPVTVRGTLHTETGALTERATLWIMGQAGEGGGESGHNGSGAEGKFEIADVGPGTHTISAETLNKTAPLFGVTTVEVRGEDLDSVHLVLRPIPKIEGEVRVEGGGSAKLNLGSIFFTRTDQVTPMSMQIGRPDQDRRFTIALIPGEYNLSFDVPAGNFDVQRITLDGRPIADWKLQIDGSPEPKKLVIVLGAKQRP